MSEHGFNHKILIAIGLALACPSLASAQDEVRLLPGGIVFPEVNDPTLANPAAISEHDTASLQVLGQPPILGATTQDYSADFTYSKSGLAAEVGYYYQNLGNTGGGPTTTQTLHAAGAFTYDQIEIGAAYEPGIGTNANNPNLEIGFIFGAGKGFNFAAVLDNLSSAASLNVGVGYSQPKMYTMEVDLDLPSFSQGLTTAGSPYTFQIAASVYAGIFGLGYNTYYAFDAPGTPGGPSFIDSPLGLTQSLAILFKPKSSLAVTLRFSTNDLLTLGVNLAF